MQENVAGDRHSEPWNIFRVHGGFQRLAADEAGPDRQNVNERFCERSPHPTDVDAIGQGDVYGAEISADYSRSEYALQYYFELQHTEKVSTMFPGLGPSLMDRPYFLVEQA